MPDAAIVELHGDLIARSAVRVCTSALNAIAHDCTADGTDSRGCRATEAVPDLVAYDPADQAAQQHAAAADFLMGIGHRDPLHPSIVNLRQRRHRTWRFVDASHAGHGGCARAQNHECGKTSGCGPA